jgi:hypothetical protein
MQTFIDPDLLDRLRVGPLASYLDAYLKRIEQEGFLPSSVPMQMYGIARFSNWLQTRQPDVHLLNEATIERFLQRDQNIVHSAESAASPALSGDAARNWGCGGQAVGTNKRAAAVLR